MNWSAIGAVFLALAVILGAFGAHGLKDRLDAYSMGVWEKAVFYHFIHAHGRPGGFPAAADRNLSDGRRFAGRWLLTAGILIFSGSLYLLAVTGVHTLGAITPIGGVCFIAAWLLLAYYFIAQRGITHEQSPGGPPRARAPGNDRSRLPARSSRGCRTPGRNRAPGRRHRA